MNKKIFELVTGAIENAAEATNNKMVRHSEVGDSEGKEERTYLKRLDEEDLFFNAKDVKAYDIIIACCWDNYKRRKSKSYYIVLDINDDQMTLDNGHTTYLKTVKASKELRNELQNEETI